MTADKKDPNPLTDVLRDILTPPDPQTLAYIEGRSDTPPHGKPVSPDPARQDHAKWKLNQG